MSSAGDVLVISSCHRRLLCRSLVLPYLLTLSLNMSFLVFNQAFHLHFNSTSRGDWGPMSHGDR